MSRFFLILDYNGTRFNGWQSQPNAPSIQAHLEEKMRLLLRQPIELTGCGRTDTGVHAKNYVAHFDFEGEFPKNWLSRLNQMLGKDIFIKKIQAVATDAHARFDATSRSYEYHLTFEKDPFRQETTWHYPHVLDYSKLQNAATLLLDYQDFAPFCKTNSDAQTMKCTLTEARWSVTEGGVIFHISANRFLRGMVRLIVGMCLNVAEEKILISDVKNALDQQITLKKSYSVPPTGLFLTKIIYPYL